DLFAAADHDVPGSSCGRVATQARWHSASDLCSILRPGAPRGSLMPAAYSGWNDGCTMARTRTTLVKASANAETTIVSYSRWYSSRNLSANTDRSGTRCSLATAVAPNRKPTSSKSLRNMIRTGEQQVERCDNVVALVTERASRRTEHALAHRHEFL